VFTSKPEAGHPAVGARDNCGFDVHDNCGEVWACECTLNGEGVRVAADG
jgi:hypothetical protein